MRISIKGPAPGIYYEVGISCKGMVYFSIGLYILFCVIIIFGVRVVFEI